MKSKKYPNLHKYDDRPNWVFRKYSSQKRKEFIKSTGETDEARAYKEGLRLFNDWLGSMLPDGRDVLVRDLARAILVSKESKKERTYNTAKNQLQNHVIPHFGHLKPSEITPLRWNQYDSIERQRIYRKILKPGHVREWKRTKLWNTRKALLEILLRARDEGLIHFVPKLKNHDSPAKPPRYLDHQVVRKILHASSPTTKLLIFIVYRSGARPGEVMQYRWDMINWKDGKHGSISIPGTITKTGRSRKIPLNSRVSRILKWLAPRAANDLLLFPSRTDSSKPMGDYSSGFVNACARAGVKVDMYNFRDTYITNSLKRGINSAFIAKYVDSSIVMIDKKYAVAEGDAMREAAG